MRNADEHAMRLQWERATEGWDRVSKRVGRKRAELSVFTVEPWNSGVHGAHALTILLSPLPPAPRLS